MSRIVSDYEYTMDWELGEYVRFTHEGEWLDGRIVRVYNSGDMFHVEANGRRYEVDLSVGADRMVRA